MIHESEIPGSDSAVLHRAEQIVQSRGLLLSIAERLMSDAMRSQVAASDVVQQALLEAIRDQASFRGSSEQELTQWLIQILKHRIIDEARRLEVRREHMPLKSKSTLQIQQSINQTTLLSDLVAQETIQQLLHAIEDLELHQQTIVRLRYIELLSFDKIGESMNLSHDAVRRLWLKAMQSLGRQLGAESE